MRIRFFLSIFIRLIADEFFSCAVGPRWGGTRKGLSASCSSFSLPFAPKRIPRLAKFTFRPPLGSFAIPSSLFHSVCNSSSEVISFRYEISLSVKRLCILVSVRLLQDDCFAPTFRIQIEWLQAAEDELVYLLISLFALFSLSCTSFRRKCNFSSANFTSTIIILRIVFFLN